MYVKPLKKTISFLDSILKFQGLAVITHIPFITFVFWYNKKVLRIHILNI